MKAAERTRMEHPAIDDEEVIERYLRGRLPAEQALAFERHYLHCQACLDQLEAETEFSAALRRTAARGLLEAPREEGRLLRFAGFAAPRPRWLAFAALLLAAVALAFLAGRELPPHAGAVPGFAGVEERLLPVFLGVVRGTEGAPPVELKLGDETGSVLLIYELPAAAAGSGYGLALRRQGREIWRSGQLAANDLGLTVAVPRRLLEKGDYELEASAPGESGGESILGRAAFRVR